MTKQHIQQRLQIKHKARTFHAIANHAHSTFLKNDSLFNLLKPTGHVMHQQV